MLQTFNENLQFMTFPLFCLPEKVGISKKILAEFENFFFNNFVENLRKF